MKKVSRPNISALPATSMAGTVPGTPSASAGSRGRMPGAGRGVSMPARRRRHALVGVAAGAWLLGALPTSAESYGSVVLRGLDKVTARTTTIEVPVGSAVSFGTLRIRAETCDKRPPEETPESAAFLDITDGRIPEGSGRLFSGWMFASSPGLSALQHPVYDVWVLDCINKVESSPDNASSEGAE